MRGSWWPFDVVARWLRFSRYNLTYVRNHHLTSDDKINPPRQLKR